jgi:hypothetical protein
MQSKYSWALGDFKPTVDYHALCYPFFRKNMKTYLLQFVKGGLMFLLKFLWSVTENFFLITIPARFIVLKRLLFHYFVQMRANFETMSILQGHNKFRLI